MCRADGYSQKHRKEKHDWILTIHLSIKIQTYVEDENDILIEDDIVKYISFNGCISGTTDVLVDTENLFGKISLKKKKSKIRTGARETHELCWRKYLAGVTKSSNVSVPEIIPLTKFQTYANNDLFVNSVSRIKSVKSALWMKEGGDEELAVAPTYDIPNKNVCYLAALQNIGITQNNNE